MWPSLAHRWVSRVVREDVTAEEEKEWWPLGPLATTTDEWVDQVAAELEHDGRWYMETVVEGEDGWVWAQLVETTS